MHEKEVKKAYTRELMGAMILYAAMLAISTRIGRPMEDSLLRTLILVSPMIGFFLAIWVIARHFARVDEYVRRVALESLAIAAAATAGFSFTYGFLETAGFPKITMFSIWPIMGGVWFLVCVIRWKRGA